jgi:hypothetical protein
MTQVCFSGHGILGSNSPEAVIGSSGIDVDIDSFRELLATLLGGLSFFSAGVVGIAGLVAMAADLKSKAVPGVLGVFVADPNEANAPEPRPNAEEPPVVGDATLGVNGDTPLKGFLPPCDESPPNRFVVEKVRWGCSAFSFCCSECDMDRESLLVLWSCVSSVHVLACGEWTWRTWSGGSKGSPCYPWITNSRFKAEIMRAGSGCTVRSLVG